MNRIHLLRLEAFIKTAPEAVLIAGCRLLTFAWFKSHFFIRQSCVIEQNLQAMNNWQHVIDTIPRFECLQTNSSLSVACMQAWCMGKVKPKSNEFFRAGVSMLNSNDTNLAYRMLMWSAISATAIQIMSCWLQQLHILRYEQKPKATSRYASIFTFLTNPSQSYLSEVKDMTITIYLLTACLTFVCLTFDSFISMHSVNRWAAYATLAEQYCHRPLSHYHCSEATEQSLGFNFVTVFMYQCMMAFGLVAPALLRHSQTFGQRIADGARAVRFFVEERVLDIHEQPLHQL